MQDDFTKDQTHQGLLTELRSGLANFTYHVSASDAMQLYDINKVAEGFVLGLMREIMGLRNLRNLNAEEKANFPGIDLADDQAKVAVQVTSERKLEKVNVADLRKRLFMMLGATLEEAGLAEACLTAIDELRDEHGRIDSEPRHPDIMSSRPWPLAAANFPD